MKKVALVIFLLSLGLFSKAQVIYSTSESNRLLTAYTMGAANDSVFVFCASGGELSANGSGGTGPYTFTWYKYQVSQHQFSSTAYVTQTGASSTVTGLTAGGYKVVVKDAFNAVVGCDIAWVWNLDVSVDAGSNVAGCSPFSLNGSVNDNSTGNFTYYNPPADAMIVDASTTISVQFTGNHTFVSDLGFYLFGPPSCGSPSVALSPNPGSIGQNNICNSGNDFTNLIFTTTPSANLNVCTATVPLSGTYSSYGASNTVINWNPIYGCDASGGGWVVKVFDCVASDVGMLTNASIIFTGNGQCGPNTINYNSGPINATIADNTCSASAAASYTVPLSADTTPIQLSNVLAYNWTANPSTAITNANTLSPSVNPNPTTDTWFYLNVSGTYGCDKKDSVFFDYTAAGTPTITAVGPLCSNSSPVSMTVSPTGGTWSGVGITDTVNGVFDPVVAGAGTFSIKFTGTGCIGKDSTTITVNQAASVAIMSNIAVCDGQTVNAITFTVNPPSSSLSWTNSQTSIGLAGSGNGNIPSFTAMNGTQLPVTANVTATAMNAGCSAGPVSFSITVNPLPIPNAGADTGLCVGGSVTLNGSGGGTYSWLPANNLNNSTVPNPVASPVSTTVYTLTVTNSFACSASDTVRVTVHPLPTVSGGPNKIICFGSSVQLSGSGAATYTWAPASSLSNSGIANPIASPTSTTQYTVVGTSVFGCSKQAMVTVVVNPAPTVNAGPDVAICAGSSTALNGSGTANSYTWSPASGLANSNSLNTNATPMASVNYILTGTASNGCIAKDTMHVTVNPLPLANAGNDTGFCVGSSVQLNATGGTTYSWSPATALSSATINNPIATPATQTQYVVTVSDVNGCIKKDSLLVSPHSLPNVDAGITQSICPGGSVALNATGATTYSWSPAASLTSGTSATPTASPSSTTQYTVTGTDATGCKKADTVSVLVRSVWAVSTNGNQTICFGDTISLTASTSGATSYSWNPSQGLSSANSSNTDAYPTQTTTYVVTASGGNNCPGTATVVVQVNQLPTINIPSIFSLCSGVPRNVSASGAQTYTWQPGTGLSNPNGQSTAVTLTANATYTLTGTDVNGCVNSAVMSAIVNANPTIDTLMTSPSNCGSQTGTIQVGAVTGQAPFLYSLNNGVGQSSNQFTGLGAGNYNITVTDNNSCKSSMSASVTAVNNVHASFTATPTSGSYPLGVSFTNATTGANTYHWDLGNGSTSAVSDPSTVYGVMGAYTVTLIAYNNIPSCSDTATLVIEVLDQPKVVIPNIVTPNGDDINEEFSLIGYGIASYDAAFYDRWGKKVGHVVGDANTKWNPQDLHDGTYFYVISVTTIDNKTKEYKGHLTILR